MNDEWGRVALLIDGPAFTQATAALRLALDYRRLLCYLRARGWLLRALYYTPLLPKSSSSAWFHKFCRQLSERGYVVVAKPTVLVPRPFIDAQGQRCWLPDLKDTIDMELTVTAWELAPHCDTLVLAAHHDHFVPVVEMVQQQGCRVLLLGSCRARGATVEPGLQRQVDQLLELDELRAELAVVHDK